MPEKVSVNQRNSKKQRNVVIPGYAWWLVSIGALIAGSLGWSSAYLNIQNADIIFLLTTLIAFIMGIIPVCLATFLERKHRATIYWLSFFSVWMPAGILVWSIAIIWSIFDKRG